MTTRPALLMLMGFGLCTGALVAQSAHAKTQQKPDAREVAVRGPTLIATFVATQADVDSSGDVNEALSDYEYYLSLAEPVLQKHGVKVHLTNDSTVRWRDNRGSHQLSANGRILYLFITPKGDTTVLRTGVELDEAILEAARDRFHLTIPGARPDSGER